MIVPKASTAKNSTSVASEILDLARSFESSNLDSVLFYSKKSLDYSSKIDSKLDAYILIIRTNIKRGEYIDAFRSSDSALELVKKGQLKDREHEVLINQGIIYRAVGMSSNALESFFEALNDSNLSVTEKSNLYYYVGLTYYDLGYINECKDYILQSINIGETNNLKEQIVSSYLTYSTTFNEIDSIQFYLNKASLALQMVNSSNLLEERIVLKNKQALLNKSLNNYNLGQQYYIEAISIAKEMNFPFHLSSLFNNYAYLKMAKAEYDSAKFYLNNALEIAMKIKSVELEYEIYDSFSDYYRRIGDFKTSLDYKELFIQKVFEYNENQDHQRSQFLTAIFEKEQKEKEILIKENRIRLYGIYLLIILFFLGFTILIVFYYRHHLKLSNSQIELYNKTKALDIADAMIEGQDMERQRLAIDLHDGLAAQLASIRYYIRGSVKDEEIYGVINSNLDIAYQNIRSLSHRMLPPMLEETGLVFTLRTMINSLNKTQGLKINFESDFKDRLTGKLENNIYFLVSELVSNAVKHSKGTEAFVQLSKSIDKLTILVEDNGGNFDKFNSNHGLGMKSIVKRVDYLNGTLHTESNEEATIFLINIPI